MIQEAGGKCKIELLTETQIHDAAHALARAFHDDPVCQYMIPDEQERAERMPEGFIIFATYAHLAGEAWVTAGEVQGAALWFPPEHTEMNSEHMETAGFQVLPSKMGEGPTERLFQFLGHMDEFRERDMAQPHWYLMILGVDPPVQSKGIGSALLQAVFDRADRAGVCCYLETAQPRNVPFYRKRGFEIVVEDIEPVSNIKFWTFKRQPGTSNKGS